MVGPDSVVSTAGAAASDDDVQRRQRRWIDDDDDSEFDDEDTTTTSATTTTRASAVKEADIVQLLARRLSLVTPPPQSDAAAAACLPCRPTATVSTSTECDSIDSGTASDDDCSPTPAGHVMTALVRHRPPALYDHLQPAAATTTAVEWMIPEHSGRRCQRCSDSPPCCPLYSLLSNSSSVAVVRLTQCDQHDDDDTTSSRQREVCRCAPAAAVATRLARLTIVAADSPVVADTRKRLYQLGEDLMSFSSFSSCCDEDQDWTLDSEVSELLRSRYPGSPASSVVDHSPCKRPRQPAHTGPPHPVNPSLAARSAHHAGAGSVAHLPRPSLDFYKMQRTSLKRRHVTSAVRGNLNRQRPPLTIQATSRRDRAHQRFPVTCCDPSNFRFRSLSWTVPCGE